MKFAGKFAITAALAAMMFSASSVRAQGLYGDESKKVTTGELNDQDYWWARFDAMMLEMAIQQHQPEGKISINIESSIRRLNDLSKKYPNHQEIAKMKARALEVEGKINPNAPRGGSFGPECPWDEANFAQLWINLHWAKTAFAAKDYSTARSDLQNVMQNYEFMLRPDRMKNYPPELSKYVVDSKPEADKLYKAVKEKTGG